MIEDGVKVETDTSRTLDATSFDAAFADDAEDEQAAAEPVAATAQGKAEAPPAAPVAEEAPGLITPETATAGAPTLPDGYKLDSLGRLHGPDGRVVSKDEAAKILTPAPEAPVVAAPAAKPSPFQYRSQGQTKTVEGWAVTESGDVVVPVAHANELRHLKAMEESLHAESSYADTVKAENAQLKQRLEQSEKGQTAEIARANALVDAYSRMAQEPDEAKAIEAFFQFRANFPVLLARAEAQHYRTLAERGRPQPSETAQPERATPEVPAPPTREIAWETTQDHIERMKIDHALRDISPDDWKQFEARASRNPHAYTRPASPEEAQRLRVPAGSYVFDDIALKADIDDYAKQLRTVRETAKARTFNAGSQTPTPAVPQKPKPRPAAATATSRGPSFDEAWNDNED